MITMTRRSIFPMITAGILPAFSAVAAPPANGRVLPTAHRRRFGSFEVTSLCDGYTGFQQAWVTNIESAAWTETAKRAFLPDGPVPTSVNVFAVVSEDRTVLIDTGSGRFWDPANCGRLPAALAFAGITPGRVDAIVITHLHADHAGGLLEHEGNLARFPNAQLFVADAEASYWLSADARSRAPEKARAGFDRAAAWMKPYGDRTTRFAASAQVLPGIEAMALPGHTPGHTGLLVGDGAERLLIVGDLVQVIPFQFDNPSIGTVLDIDGEAATATRRRILDMASADRVMIAGSHIPFPGLGFVARAGDGYGFIPAPWPVGI